MEPVQPAAVMLRLDLKILQRSAGELSLAEQVVPIPVSHFKKFGQVLERKGRLWRQALMDVRLVAFPSVQSVVPQPLFFGHWILQNPVPPQTLIRLIETASVQQ